MNLASINAVNLFTDHRDFLHDHVNQDAMEKLVVVSPKLQTALGVVVIDDSLRQESANTLNNLCI